ncbi:hypothetical protein [Streptomyces sp. NPDC127595]|uniref:hypothetical protein n=1 Tax=Streptomyces sp. NPDC127595 TaxID=3345405 RepID=UPI00362AEA06
MDGAQFLFTNEYEAAFLREHTGWSEMEILARVGTWITTLGAEGVSLTRAGRSPLRVLAVRSDQIADPRGRLRGRRRCPREHRLGPAPRSVGSVRHVAGRLRGRATHRLCPACSRTLRGVCLGHSADVPARLPDAGHLFCSWGS